MVTSVMPARAAPNSMSTHSGQLAAQIATCSPREKRVNKARATFSDAASSSTKVQHLRSASTVPSTRAVLAPWVSAAARNAVPMVCSSTGSLVSAGQYACVKPGLRSTTTISYLSRAALAASASGSSRRLRSLSGGEQRPPWAFLNVSRSWPVGCREPTTHRFRYCRARVRRRRVEHVLRGESPASDRTDGGTFVRNEYSRESRWHRRSRSAAKPCPNDDSEGARRDPHEANR